MGVHVGGPSDPINNSSRVAEWPRIGGLPQTLTGGWLLGHAPKSECDNAFVPGWSGKQNWTRAWWASLAILATCSAMLGGSASATNGVRFSVFKTSLPGGQKLRPGALVAAATRFDGKWVAAGRTLERRPF